MQFFVVPEMKSGTILGVSWGDLGGSWGDLGGILGVFIGSASRISRGRFLKPKVLTAFQYALTIGPCLSSSLLFLPSIFSLDSATASLMPASYFFG